MKKNQTWDISLYEIMNCQKKKEDGNGITVPILPASANNKNEKERKETDTESLQL